MHIFVLNWEISLGVIGKTFYKMTNNLWSLGYDLKKSSRKFRIPGSRFFHDNTSEIIAWVFTS